MPAPFPHGPVANKKNLLQTATLTCPNVASHFTKAKLSSDRMKPAQNNRFEEYKESNMNYS